jgi:hypothetical protein
VSRCREEGEGSGRGEPARSPPRHRTGEIGGRGGDRAVTPVKGRGSGDAGGGGEGK